MNRPTPSTRSLLLSLLLLPALAACSGDEQELKILPLVARFDAGSAPSADPAIFFTPSAADTNPGDDVVVVDVMLRATAGLTFNAFTMEIEFDHGVVQVGQVDLTATPMGDCTSQSAGHPICQSNANAANQDGTLLIGAAAQGGAVVSVTGDQKLFTLRFVGATVGFSDLTFTQGAGNGDCEILDAALNDLGVTCHNGAPPDTAQVTVAR